MGAHDAATDALDFATLDQKPEGTLAALKKTLYETQKGSKDKKVLWRSSNHKLKTKTNPGQRAHLTKGLLTRQIKMEQVIVSFSFSMHLLL